MIWAGVKLALPKDHCRRSPLHALLILLFAAISSATAGAQAPDSRAERIDRVMNRPEFRHATLSIKLSSLNPHKVV